MWIVELNINNTRERQRLEPDWQPLSTNGKPDEYDDPEAAAKTACMCYPDQAREDRLDHERKWLRLKNLDTNEYDDVWRHAR